ncbi:sigma-70 family RNA polymerase sigma factor [Kitasatospora sp. NPDC052868]|uniref:sigma-70 family RNA polymerase sigma factor n=1 Tax=Kitasatospora sp. NPDC052868 TaxID=3364060 RepID=UPI0037CB37CB
MAADESAYRNPEAPTEALTEDQVGRMLADMNEVIRAGEEMRALRTEMIKVLAGLGWTQDKIARLTGMSQPAVSKQVAKYRDDPPAPMALALDQRDTPWLEGRLWGLAEEIAQTLGAAARCTRHVRAVARGRVRFTPRSVDELRRLVEEDLRVHRADLPAAYRDTYDAVARGLDLPAHGAPAPVEPAPVEPASVRRALAQRVQRDRLRDAS